MKATLTTQNRNAENYGFNKEMIKALSVVALDNHGKPVEVITARWYMGRSSSASTMLCSVWIHAPGFHTSGSGKAGWYGYCKSSAAFADAITDAGIELSEPVHGVGSSAVIEACRAIVCQLSLGTQTEPLFIEH